MTLSRRVMVEQRRRATTSVALGDSDVTKAKGFESTAAELKTKLRLLKREVRIYEISIRKAESDAAYLMFERFYDTAEVSEMLDLSPREVRRKLELSEWPSIKICGKWWVEKSAIDFATESHEYLKETLGDLY